MAIGPRLELRQTQNLVMTPQLRQAIKLLQFSNMEVNAFVEEELERNPLLERDERSDAPADERAALDQVLPAETTPGDAADFAGSDVMPDNAASPLDTDHGETYEPGSPSDGEAYAHAGSGKGGVSTPSARAAFQPQRGSTRKARACAVQSAWPEATMCSACWGSVMTPTAQLLIPASLRMRAANSTW